MENKLKYRIGDRFIHKREHLTATIVDYAIVRRPNTYTDLNLARDMEAYVVELDPSDPNEIGAKGILHQEMLEYDWILETPTTKVLYGK